MTADRAQMNGPHRLELYVTRTPCNDCATRIDRIRRLYEAGGGSLDVVVRSLALYQGSRDAARNEETGRGTRAGGTYSLRRLQQMDIRVEVWDLRARRTAPVRARGRYGASWPRSRAASTARSSSCRPSSTACRWSTSCRGGGGRRANGREGEGRVNETDQPSKVGLVPLDYLVLPGRAGGFASLTVLSNLDRGLCAGTCLVLMS